jgi:hypothetical protein
MLSAFLRWQSQKAKLRIAGQKKEIRKGRKPN